MSLWQINVMNEIKVVSETPSFSLFHKHETQSGFTEFPITQEVIDAGYDNLYLVPITFQSSGKYLIKLKQTIAPFESLYDEIIVHEGNVMLTNQRYEINYNQAHVEFQDGPL